MQEALERFYPMFATTDDLALPHLEIDEMPVWCTIRKRTDFDGGEFFMIMMGHPRTREEYVGQAPTLREAFKLIDQLRYCSLSDNFRPPSEIDAKNTVHKDMVTLLPNLYKEKDTICCVCHDPCKKLEFMHCKHLVCRLCWHRMKKKKCPQCRVNLKRPCESDDESDDE